MKSPDVTIVTGGGRGIGRAISRRMAKQTPVVVVGQNRDNLDSIVLEITAAGGTAELVVGDVSDRQTAIRTMEIVAERGWTVRNLICNAGLGKGGPAVAFDDDVFIRLFEVNVFGTWWFIKNCLPSMVAAKRGTICLMSSIVAVHPCKNDAPYCATKGAINAMAASLALEYAKHGLAVVPMCPSYVESEMTDRSIAGLANRKNLSLEEAREKIAQSCPGGRILPADELAEAIATICINPDPALSGKPYLLQ